MSEQRTRITSHFPGATWASDGDAGAAAAGCMAQVATKRVASVARPSLLVMVDLLAGIGYPTEIWADVNSIARRSEQRRCEPPGPRPQPQLRSLHLCQRLRRRLRSARPRPHHEQHRELQSDRAAGLVPAAAEAPAAAGGGVARGGA